MILSKLKRTFNTCTSKSTNETFNIVQLKCISSEFINIPIISCMSNFCTNSFISAAILNLVQSDFIVAEVNYQLFGSMILKIVCFAIIVLSSSTLALECYTCKVNILRNTRVFQNYFLNMIFKRNFGPVMLNLFQRKLVRKMKCAWWR